MNNKVAVILYGPQGSGKGTQAKLLSERLNLFHFDTGAYLRSVLFNPKFKNNKEIQKERKINEAGILNSPQWVLKVVSERISELARLGQAVVLSGSPRTMFEAFGDSENKGVYPLLEKVYGKKNIYIFNLEIPQSESLKRTSSRVTCSICGTMLMAQYKSAKKCPFCGGQVEKRADDNKKSIFKRLKEYKERTLPIFTELKKRGYKVYKIDATPAPYKIFGKLITYFKK